jgi:hypothetical protein
LEIPHKPFVIAIIPSISYRTDMRGFTIEEISKITGMSPYVIRNQIHIGNLVARKLSPNYVRILEADLKDWLERAAQKAVHPEDVPVAQ